MKVSAPRLFGPRLPTAVTPLFRSVVSTCCPVAGCRHLSTLRPVALPRCLPSTEDVAHRQGGCCGCRFPARAVSSVGNAVFLCLAEHSLFSLGLLEKQQRVLCLGRTVPDPLATEVLMCSYLSVADVAAIACGREFLVTSSRVLLDTMLQLLGDLKPGQCTKLKVYAGRQ